MCFISCVNGCSKGTNLNAAAVYEPQKTGPYFNGASPTMQVWCCLLAEVYQMCLFGTAESRAAVWPLSKGCVPFRARSVSSARRRFVFGQQLIHIWSNDNRDTLTGGARTALAKEVFAAVYGTPVTSTMFPRTERSFAHLCGEPKESKASWSHYLACSKVRQYGPEAVRCCSTFHTRATSP